MLRVHQAWRPEEEALQFGGTGDYSDKINTSLSARWRGHRLGFEGLLTVPWSLGTAGGESRGRAVRVGTGQMKMDPAAPSCWKSGHSFEIKL